MASIFTKIVFATAIATMSISPVMAQDTLRALNDSSQNEARAMLNLSIPFGGQREEAKPRVELKFQSLTAETEVFTPVYISSFDRISRESRIGFTLSEKPVLMLNGRKLETSDYQQNLSTGAGIAIAAGVTAAVVLIVASDVRDAISDINDPD